MKKSKTQLDLIVGFSWDKDNKDKNWDKHGVSSKECEEIFFDKPVYFPDANHSKEEKRYVAYGQTKEQRNLTIVFTMREGFHRVISGRDQSKKEKDRYALWLKEVKK